MEANLISTVKQMCGWKTRKGKDHFLEVKGCWRALFVPGHDHDHDVNMPVAVTCCTVASPCKSHEMCFVSKCTCMLIRVG